MKIKEFVAHIKTTGEFEELDEAGYVKVRYTEDGAYVYVGDSNAERDYVWMSKRDLARAAKLFKRLAEQANG